MRTSNHTKQGSILLKIAWRSGCRTFAEDTRTLKMRGSGKSSEHVRGNVSRPADTVPPPPNLQAYEHVRHDECHVTALCELQTSRPPKHLTRCFHECPPCQTLPCKSHPVCRQRGLRRSEGCLGRLEQPCAGLEQMLAQMREACGRAVLYLKATGKRR